MSAVPIHAGSGALPAHEQQADAVRKTYNLAHAYDHAVPPDVPNAVCLQARKDLPVMLERLLSDPTVDQAKFRAALRAPHPEALAGLDHLVPITPLERAQRELATVTAELATAQAAADKIEALTTQQAKLKQSVANLARRS